MSSSLWRPLQQSSKRDGEREPLSRSSAFVKTRGGTAAATDNDSNLNSKTAPPGSNRAAEFRSPKRPTAAAVLRGGVSKSPPTLRGGERANSAAAAAAAARGRAATSVRPLEERPSRAQSTPFGSLERRSSLGYDGLPAMPARVGGSGAAGEWDAETGRWKVIYNIFLSLFFLSLYVCIYYVFFCCVYTAWWGWGLVNTIIHFRGDDFFLPWGICC